MFDGDSRIFLVLAAAAASVFMATAEQTGPPDAVETAVEIATLPPIPLSATSNGAPAQTRVASMQVPLADGFQAELLYGYALDGRVVTRREFRNDPTSPVSPLDLGIVWGDLARPGGVDAFEFRTGPRVLRSRASADAVLPDGWDEQITNNHLIPASPEVMADLMAVRVGQHVRIRGFLVVVTGDDIRPWRSSTRRNDGSIIGGCEIILVTGVELLPPVDTPA